MNTLIAYNSITGNTEICAGWIRDCLHRSGHSTSLQDILDVYPSTFSAYDLIVVGMPTYSVRQMTYDLDLFLQELGNADLAGKQAAVFGLGDLADYPDEYCTAADTIERALRTSGANLVVECLRVNGDPEGHQQSIQRWTEKICRAASP